MTILMLPSNEGKSLSVEQHLTASGYPQSKSRIQKRDMDYFYDYNYDYGDYDTPEIVLTIPPPTPPPTKTTEQSHFDGFETFMDGLKKLQEALDNPDYDWGKVKKTPVDSVTDLPMVTPSAETYTPPPDIHELLVLIGILQQLSLSKQRTTTTPSPKNLLESAELVLGRIFHALNVEVPPEERRQILFTLAPKGNEGSVQEAVAEVSQLFQQLFGEPAVSLPPPDMASLDDSAMLLNMTMQLMENIEDEFERKIREEEHRTESSTDHYERLRSIIQELHSLSGGLVKQTTRRQVRPTATPRPTANKPNQELCTLPFVDVAYKVCILPVLDRQLSWHDARQYCRSRSLELAMDSAVIKGRKHFNNQLGEIGSRERWTLWVGGRKDEGKWEWSDGIPVPDFLWSKNQPRTFDRDSTPAGTCMAIHGFSEYYGAALPCHHRRRFVCQKM